MKTSKTPSQHAQVAKLCRQHLKTVGVQGKSRSNSGSMSASVGVYLLDASPNAFEEIKSEFNKYQYGHYNSMEDIYEVSNSRKDIPQVTYLFVENRFSDEKMTQAWDFLRNKYPGNSKDLPVEFDEAKDKQWTDNSPHYMGVAYEVGRLLRCSGFGLDADNSREFWEQIEKDTNENNQKKEA